MTLAELLQSKFRGDVRYRGADYLQAERVAITRITPNQLVAVVQDGGEIQTQLSRENGQLQMACNCAKCSRREEPACKALWATILAVDEGNYLAGTVRPDYVPPFAVEPDFDDPEWQQWEPDDDVDYPPEGGSPENRGPRLGQQVRLWESRLQKLRRKMESSQPPDRQQIREREIYYEIDLPHSREENELVLQTLQRQRRRNGQWGKLKPLKLRQGELGEIEHEEDRHILSYLIGGTPERNHWYAQQAESQTADRFRVSYELGERLLPLLCQTGRLRYSNRPEAEKKPLSWDDGPPWQLAVHVVFDETKETWCLQGALQRDEERLPLQETELLVPGGLVLTESAVARLEDFGAWDWLTLLDNDEPLTVPAGEEHELVDRLLDMPSLPRLELPEELQLEEVSCQPVPRLLLRSPRGIRWRRERLQGEVQFNYLGTCIRGSASRWAIVQREQGRCILRNREAETAAWSQLQELGFRRLLDRRRGGSDVEIGAQELGSAVRALMENGWEVEADGNPVHQPAELNFRVTSNIDWFELHADVDFEGRTVAFPELLSALSRGDSTVRLDDGSLGILPEDWFNRYGLLAGLGTAEDEHIRFQPNQIALLDALLASRESVEYDQRFAELRERFHSFSGVTPAEEPPDFQGELREYQRQGLGWLQFLEEFQLGGCLADDMGLGKTVQVLAVLQQHLRQAEEHRPSLIVVPKSLLFNWRQECERFTPDLKLLEYTGLDRAKLRGEFSEHDIVVTTYGTLRRDIVSLKDVSFEYVVLDEAQTIKNAGSQVAKAARLLQGQHRIALSGTPIENHLSDLWSIFEFLNPGMLGRSSAFKLYASDNDDEEARRLLSRGLRPFILRRTKEQVANELPEKFEQTIYCDLGEEQQKLYNDLRDHYRTSLLGMIEEQGLAKSKMHVLEALLRLRQAACHPALLDNGSEEDSSAKLDVLCSHLDELLDEGHKTLVFSQFTSMLAIVKHHLEKREIDYSYLDGQTRQRQQAVDRFQEDPDCGVFLVSLKAGGLGLNLTAADYVFLLDPWWNPAVESQAIDRAHRVGQTRQVFAYRLICRNTVEEKIAELQNQKRSLAEAILETDKGNLLKELSTEDLEVLLS